MEVKVLVLNGISQTQAFHVRSDPPLAEPKQLQQQLLGAGELENRETVAQCAKLQLDRRMNLIFFKQP